MDEDMFERLVADQELDGLLDDPEWVPTESEMRKFRAFNASPDLLAQARRRIEIAEGDIEEDTGYEEAVWNSGYHTEFGIG